MKQRQTQNKPRRNIDGGLEKVATKIEKLKMYPSDLPCQKNGNTDREKKRKVYLQRIESSYDMC